MKPTFLNHTKPILTNMMQVEIAEECIITVRNAIYDGADAIGLQLCKLKPEYRNPEIYERIFANIGPRPIYLTNYRHNYNEGLSDEACMEGLMEGMKAGGTLCDIMGDTFEANSMEITYDNKAVEKQKILILSTKTQPVLRAAKMVLDHMDYLPEVVF